MMKTHFPHKDPHRPENLITLCKECHNGKDGVHPDMWAALMNYRAGNKAAFDDVMKGRQMLVERGHVYWNTMWDWFFSKRAKHRTRKFARGNRYPEKRRRRK